MGGNSRAVDITGEVISYDGRAAYAEKMNFYLIERADFIADFRAMIHALNAAFEEEKGYPIWNFKRVRKIYNGSSAFLFDETISDREFRTTKSSVGDIDIMVPAEILPDLWDFLKANERKRIGEFVYVGNNKVSRTSIASQINTIFFYRQSFSGIFCQVDFEGVEFENEGPTEWARFSHSASWSDMKLGIKGVVHKFMLQSVANVMGRVPNSIELTPKSPVTDVSELRKIENDIHDIKVELKENPTAELHKQLEELEKEQSRIQPRIPKGKENRDVSRLTFSVLYGLRNKMKQQFTPRGEPVSVQGRLAFKAIPTSESQYINKPEEIFEKIFQRKPSPQALNKFYSFQGLLELLAAEDLPTLQLIRDEFIRRLWGFTPAESRTMLNPEDVTTAAQALERDSWQTDFEVKSGALEVFFMIFPKTRLSEDELKKILLLYYGPDGTAYSTLRSRGKDHDEIT